MKVRGILRYGDVSIMVGRASLILFLSASMLFCTGVQISGLLMGSIGTLGFVLPAGWIGLICAYCAARLLRRAGTERPAKTAAWCAFALLPLIVEVGLFSAVYWASFNAVFLIHALQVVSVILAMGAAAALISGILSDERLFALYGVCTAYLLVHSFIFHALCDMSGALPLEAKALRVAVIGIAVTAGAAAAGVWKILR